MPTRMVHLTISLIIACAIYIQTNFSIPKPLIMEKRYLNGNKTYTFLRTKNKNNTVAIGKGESVMLVCPASFVVLEKGEKLKKESLKARCSEGGKFTLEGYKKEAVSLSDINCKNYPRPKAVLTNQTCAGSYQEYTIGIKVKSTYVNLMTFCFNKTEQRTLYVKYVLSPQVSKTQATVKRPFKWIEEDLFGDTFFNEVYSRRSQRRTINRILGLPSNDEEYIEEGYFTEMFLARGQLSPKGDHVFEASQFLTFHYINTAPQWTTFNMGNWMALKRSYKKFIGMYGVDIEVYSGTHGKTTLPDVYGAFRELYLSFNEKKQIRTVPIPQLFWKILYDRTKKAGIAFVGVNNPHYFNYDKDVICNNICSMIPWISWDAKNIAKGYAYCCDVNDLRKAIKTIPRFEVVKLLL